MANCLLCRKESKAGARFCLRCGKELPDAPEGAIPPTILSKGLTCPECEMLNPEGNTFCIQCGTFLRSPTPKQRRTERLVSGEESKTAYLRHVVSEPGTGDYPLADLLVIGRDPAAALRFVEDPFLSDRHAQVVREGRAYILKDLHSTNGTFVRIRGPTELRPGDHLMIGEQVFKFVV